MCSHLMAMVRKKLRNVCVVHGCTWVYADMHAGVCAPVWGPEVNLEYLLLLLTLFL